MAQRSDYCDDKDLRSVSWICECKVKSFPISDESPDSSSTNAVNFSSACTTKRFPSLQCASAIQIVRPRSRTQIALESFLIARRQMSDQYFIDHFCTDLRCWYLRFRFLDAEQFGTISHDSAFTGRLRAKRPG